MNFSKQNSMQISEILQLFTPWWLFGPLLHNRNKSFPPIFGSWQAPPALPHTQNEQSIFKRDICNNSFFCLNAKKVIDFSIIYVFIQEKCLKDNNVKIICLLIFKFMFLMPVQLFGPNILCYFGLCKKRINRCAYFWQKRIESNFQIERLFVFALHELKSCAFEWLLTFGYFKMHKHFDENCLRV